ncbi:MAG TPA: NUDIX domain-containing protein [Candidatus Nanoarchaeia archaeon]|nr:NUDIX domain-containing protein [Candidatus Nanoarchaeia archaeon]
MMERSAGIILFKCSPKNVSKKMERKYLILKYAEYKDYWGLCKGRIEAGETVTEAALREVQEEAGLQKISFVDGFQEKFGYFFTVNGEKIYKEVVWFLGEVLDDHDGILSSEHEDLVWLSFSEAIARITHKKDADVVKKAEDFLQKLKSNRE